LILAGT